MKGHIKITVTAEDIARGRPTEGHSANLLRRGTEPVTRYRLIPCSVPGWLSLPSIALGVLDGSLRCRTRALGASAGQRTAERPLAPP